jgi:hypothetical protein
VKAEYARVERSVRPARLGLTQSGVVTIDAGELGDRIFDAFGGGLAIGGSGSAVLTQTTVYENTNQTQHGGGIAIIDGALEAYKYDDFRKRNLGARRGHFRQHRLAYYVGQRNDCPQPVGQ